MPRPTLRRPLDPEWQEALRQAYKKEPDPLIEYFLSGKGLEDHWQRAELVQLLDRRLRRRGSEGRPPGIPPEHDRLHRLRANIIARTTKELQALRQRHGRVPYNGKRSALNEAFRHYVVRYHHNLTPRELAALKKDILTKLKKLP